uniref:Reverse transcriptase Ty1/copia-type domain-containing protein n=1 Tax=Tanacetum cinerariifolium TaxID=118510 RepID=A0A6L2JBE8_TANCI|nr:hypothetical protein [Tanacetum cinerariifolium]
MTKTSQEHAMVSYIKKQRRTNHKDYQNCLFAYFLLQIEPKKAIQALIDPSWIEAIQDELLQFKLQKVYVDDIIFGSTKKSLCTEFKGLMHKKFQMVYMGELTFFLGLQVMQRDDGIFISQDKYVADILKKFDFSSVKTTSTPIETNKALLKDMDVHLYRSMIRSLMYLEASRSDIMFAVYACARFQVTPKVSHLHAVKRIFRYLKGQLKLGLWYPRDLPFNLETFSDSDYTRASLDRKSTTGSCQFLGKRLISWQCKKQIVVANLTTEAEYVATPNCCRQIDDLYGLEMVLVMNLKLKRVVVRLMLLGRIWCCWVKVSTARNVEFHQIVDFFTTSSIHYALTQIHATIDGKTVVISESSVRSDLHFNDEDSITCLSNDAIFVNLALMGFLQLFLNNQIDLAEPFNDVYVTPVHTKKVFTNVKRQNKDFSGTVTSLFASMLTHTPRQAKRGRDTKIPQSSGPPKKVGDEAVCTKEDDRVVRAVTTATSLKAECQDNTLGDADAQTRLETASKQSHDPPFSEVNTSGSGEDSMEHQDDLTDFMPSTPHDSPLSRGHTTGNDEGRPNIAQDLVIKKMQKKVKSLEKKQSARTPRMNLFKIAMDNVEGDTVNVGGAVNTATTGVSAASASVTTVGVSISTTEPKTPLTTTTTAFEDEDLTNAQTLIKMRSEKAKEKRVAFKDVEESVRPTTILLTIDPKDKGKCIMQEPEKPPKNPRKAQIQLDKELAKRMHEEEMAELKRRQSEIVATEEASKEAINKELDDIQAMIETDEQMASRIQFEEAAEQRSKLPTKAQMRNRMYTYLKNQAGCNHNQLIGRSYDEIQKLFDKAYKQVKSFVPMDSEVVKDSGKKDDSSSKQAESRKKRAGLKLKSKSPKKLKVMKEHESAVDEQEKEELKFCLKIVQDEDRAINYETLAVTSLIIDWVSQLLGSAL